MLTRGFSTCGLLAELNAHLNFYGSGKRFSLPAFLENQLKQMGDEGIVGFLQRFVLAKTARRALGFEFL